MFSIIIRKCSLNFQRSEVLRDFPEIKGDSRAWGLPLQIKGWGCVSVSWLDFFSTSPPQQPHLPSHPDEPNSWAAKTRVYPRHNSGDLAWGVAGISLSSSRYLFCSKQLKTKPNKDAQGVWGSYGWCPLPSILGGESSSVGVTSHGGSWGRSTPSLLRTWRDSDGYLEVLPWICALPFDRNISELIILVLVLLLVNCVVAGEAQGFLWALGSCSLQGVVETADSSVTLWAEQAEKHLLFSSV